MSQATITAPIRAGGIRSFVGFVGWVCSGFGLLRLFKKRVALFKGEEVVLYSVHTAFYLWPLILCGFAGAAAVRHYPQTANLWGWIYIWAFFYTLLAILFDITTLRFLLWTLIVSFFWLTLKYVEDWKNVHMLSALFDHFHNLRPELQPGFIVILSWFMLLLWIGSLFRSFGQGRKSFSPNGIEEWFLGEGREITDRSGLHFISRYKDVFEFILGFGAGDLEAIDGNGRLIKRWENILMLFFHWKHLDEILHQRAAVVDNAPDDPVEVDQVKNRKADEIEAE